MSENRSQPDGQREMQALMALMAADRKRFVVMDGEVLVLPEGYDGPVPEPCLPRNRRRHGRRT